MLTQQRKASPATTSPAAVLSATTAAHTPKPAAEPTPDAAAPPAAVAAVAATASAPAMATTTAPAPSASAAPASATAKVEPDAPKTVAASAADAKSKVVVPPQPKPTAQAITPASLTAVKPTAPKTVAASATAAANTTSVTSDDVKINQKHDPIDNLDIKGIADALVKGSKKYLENSEKEKRDNIGIHRARIVKDFLMFLQNCLTKIEYKGENLTATTTQENGNVENQHPAKTIVEKYIVLVLKALKEINSGGLYKKYIVTELKDQKIQIESGWLLKDDYLKKWLEKYHYQNSPLLSENISSLETELKKGWGEGTKYLKIKFILFSLSNELEKIARLLTVEQRDEARKKLLAYWDLCKQELSSTDHDLTKSQEFFRLSFKRETAAKFADALDRVTDSALFKSKYHQDLDKTKDTVKKFQKLPSQISSFKIILISYLLIQNLMDMYEAFPELFEANQYIDNIYPKLRDLVNSMQHTGCQLEDIVNALYLRLIRVLPSTQQYMPSVIPAVIIFFDSLQQPDANLVPVVLPAPNAPPNEQKQFDPLASGVADPQTQVVVVYPTPPYEAKQNPEGAIVVDDDNVRRLVAADSVPSEPPPPSYEFIFPDQACDATAQELDEVTEDISDQRDETKKLLKSLYAHLGMVRGKLPFEIRRDPNVPMLRTARQITMQYFKLEVMLGDEKTVTPPPTLRK